MDENKLLDKVRKLLAKAENPATPDAERETFNEKASALIAAYGIDRARLAHAGRIRDVVTTVNISIDTPYSKDKALLLGDIASALRCQSVLTSYGRVTEYVTLVGFETDLERVELLYTSLLLQAANQLPHVRPDKAGRGKTRRYRISWMLGFRSTVYERLKAAEQAAVDSNPGDLDDSGGSGEPGTALVLVDREAQVTAVYNEMFPNLGSARKRNYGWSGYEDGKRAGERADLGSTQVQGGHRAIEQ